MIAPAVADTAARFETPEGVELELRPAGLVPRGIAWSLDFVVRGLILLGFAIALGYFGDVGEAVFVVLLFALEWFYPVFFEVLFAGVTPGKRALRLRVVRDDGAPVGIEASLVRNFLRAVDFLPAFNLFAVLSIMFTRRMQRLGDLAAGSLVVYDARTPARRRAADELAPVQSVPVPVPLLPAEQQLLVDFADRASSLSPERADELARHAKPLLRGDSPPATQLRAMAASLGGRT